MTASPGQAVVTFHDDLQRLLSAADEASSRAAMIEAFVRRGAAGAVFLEAPEGAVSTASLVGVWGVDMSGELGDRDALDIVERIAGKIPGWLAGWFLRRTRPLCFSRILRFVPVSGALLIRLTAPDGVRPIADLAMVPYAAQGRRHYAVVGFHHVIAARIYEEIVSLCLAYAVKWTGDRAPDGTAEAPQGRLDLTDRELDCVRWLVAGKTLQDVATITGLRYSTVRYHLERAKDRAGLATTQQLIAYAAVQYRLSAYGPGRSTDPASGQDEASPNRHP